MFLKMCARLKSIPEVVFFSSESNLLETVIYLYDTYARVYVLAHPLCAPLFLGKKTASCFNCSNPTPTHIGPQKDELPLPASFLPVTIK